MHQPRRQWNLKVPLSPRPDVEKLRQSKLAERAFVRKLLTSTAVELYKSSAVAEAGTSTMRPSLLSIVPCVVFDRSRAVQDASQEKEVQYVLERNVGRPQWGAEKI